MYTTTLQFYFRNYLLGAPLVSLGNSKGTFNTALLLFLASVNEVAFPVETNLSLSAVLGATNEQPKDLNRSCTLQVRENNGEEKE